MKLGERAVNKGVEALKPVLNRADAYILRQGVNLPEGLSPDQVGMINTLLPVFLGVFEKIIPVSQELRLDTPPEVLKALAEAAAKGGDFSNVLFTVGLGGSEKMPSTRLPAYIVPALECLRKLHGLKVDGRISGMPRLRIFKADGMAVKYNNFDESDVSMISQETFKFISDFVVNFYPELLPYLTMETDACLMEDAQIMALMYDLAARIMKMTDINEEVEKVRHMGNKHGGEEGKRSSILYAAAHPIFNYTILPATIDRGNQSTKLVVDFGGRPQAIFNEISIQLRRVLLEEGNPEIDLTPAMLFTLKCGKIPTYYLAREGDVELGHHLSAEKIPYLDRLIRKDFEILDEAIGLDRYIDFLDEWYRRRVQVK